jgi:hypothetical protein
MRWLLRLAALFTVVTFPATGQQSASPPAGAAFVPMDVISAKTMAVAVYWPDAGWKDKAEVQADGERFLRRWKRYKVVRLSESPDLIALVTVEPVGEAGGFWRTLAYSLSVSAQAYARSSQNYEHCHGQINGNQLDTTCYGYNPPPAATPAQAPPNFVLGGSILIFDGRFLRAGGPISEPLLFASADSHGSRPLIGAAKRLRQMIEQGATALPDRLATVDALIAKVHELFVVSKLPESEEAECSQKISQRIGTDPNMLGRVEQRDFGDVEKLFPVICAPVAASK